MATRPIVSLGLTLVVGCEWDHVPDADLGGLTVLARTGVVTPDGEQRRHEANEVQHQGEAQ